MKRKTQTIDTIYIGLSAAVIAVCSWIAITLPTGIPITLQTLGVCLTAGVFGKKRGTAAMAVYLLLGVLGVPVFSNFTGGAGVLLGATGGYLIGFIFTALIVGAVSDKTQKRWVLLLGMAAGVLACYLFGTAWFALVYARTKGAAPLLTILGWCVFPYLVPDMVKIVLAATLTVPLKKAIKKEH